MQDDKVNRLLELKKKLDAGEITKETFDMCATAICNADKGNAVAPKHESSHSMNNKRNIIIASIVGVVVLLAVGFVLIFHNRGNDEVEEIEVKESVFPDEDCVVHVVDRYCQAICENDFTTLESLYAPMLERYQDAYNKDRGYVIGCHKRYDSTFKVYGKYSSLRWDTFRMELIGDDLVSAVVVEDYSIDREDKSKNSVFVLEKHFIMNSSYEIVSVYDNQLSVSKENENFKMLYQTYARDHDLANIDDDYGGWEYVYIDEDDVPELIISSGHEAGGSLLLSIVNGRVVEDFVSLSFSYIPYMNRVLSNSGMHDNTSMMSVETLKAGKLKTILNVTVAYDDNDYSRWYINDKQVSESYAQKILNENFGCYGKSVEAGVYGDNLKPMSVFWR